jgi:hypothetical protein
MIGSVVLALIGPMPSTGSPITFRMRPSVASPTGMRMLSPVSRALMPRTRPSVVSMPMQRTGPLAEMLRDFELKLSSRSSIAGW